MQLFWLKAYMIIICRRGTGTAQFGGMHSSVVCAAQGLITLTVLKPTNYPLRSPEYHLSIYLSLP